MNGFKWRKIYATAAGFAVFMVIAGMISSVIGQSFIRKPDDYGFLLKMSCVYLGAIIAVIVFTVKFSKKLNTNMIAKSDRNQEVIRKYLNGDYEDMIPEKMKTEAGRKRILDLLTSGRATSVKGAVLMAKKKKADKIVGGALFGILALVFGSIDKAVADATADLGHAIGGSVTRVTDGIATGTLFDGLSTPSVETDNTFAIKKAKDKAVFMETQAKKTAKAAPGSYAAKRADNLAKKQRYEANHMCNR